MCQGALGSGGGGVTAVEIRLVGGSLGRMAGTRLALELSAAAVRITGVEESHVMVVIQDSPARFAVEGGQVLPEPGEEKEWPARRGQG